MVLSAFKRSAELGSITLSGILQQNFQCPENGNACPLCFNDQNNIRQISTFLPVLKHRTSVACLSDKQLTVQNPTSVLLQSEFTLEPGFSSCFNPSLLKYAFQVQKGTRFCVFVCKDCRLPIDWKRQLASCNRLYYAQDSTSFISPTILVDSEIVPLLTLNQGSILYHSSLMRTIEIVNCKLPNTSIDVVWFDVRTDGLYILNPNVIPLVVPGIPFSQVDESTSLLRLPYPVLYSSLYVKMPDGTHYKAAYYETVLNHVPRGTLTDVLCSMFQEVGMRVLNMNSYPRIANLDMLHSSIVSNYLSCLINVYTANCPNLTFSMDLPDVTFVELGDRYILRTEDKLTVHVRFI